MLHRPYWMTVDSFFDTNRSARSHSLSVTTSSYCSFVPLAWIVCLRYSILVIGRYVSRRSLAWTCRPRKRHDEGFFVFFITALQLDSVPVSVWPIAAIRKRHSLSIFSVLIGTHQDGRLIWTTSWKHGIVGWNIASREVPELLFFF